ncbi:hypothetical protein MTHERMOG20_03240 [Moorella thermoacetica]|nr:hypothetical protein MTHERMOG20_03240 [Moorella thermoacetica]
MFKLAKIGALWLKRGLALPPGILVTAVTRIIDQTEPGLSIPEAPKKGKTNYCRGKIGMGRGLGVAAELPGRLN